jgi:hypothetical protein
MPRSGNREPDRKAPGGGFCWKKRNGTGHLAARTKDSNQMQKMVKWQRKHQGSAGAQNRIECENLTWASGNEDSYQKSLCGNLGCADEPETTRGRTNPDPAPGSHKETPWPPSMFVGETESGKSNKVWRAETHEQDHELKHGGKESSIHEQKSNRG